MSATEDTYFDTPTSRVLEIPGGPFVQRVGSRPDGLSHGQRVDPRRKSFFDECLAKDRPRNKKAETGLPRARGQR